MSERVQILKLRDVPDFLGGRALDILILQNSEFQIFIRTGQFKIYKTGNYMFVALDSLIYQVFRFYVFTYNRLFNLRHSVLLDTPNFRH